MGFMDKVKKGLGTAVDGAKIASSMAIIKKDLEHAKLKKSKALKQLGEVVYNNKESFNEEIAFSELLGEIEVLDMEIERLEKELSVEGKKFNTDESDFSGDVEETEETVIEVKRELMDQDKE